jgi:exodeoxyribonuclease VII large subunit
MTDLNQNLTVTDIITQIKSLLEGEFRQVRIVGEVSNLTSSTSGHYYFTLSDKNSSLGCALFRMDAYRNPLIKKMKNGDKILCLGSIGVYGKRGTFQLLVKRIAPLGKGNLKEEFEKLKMKLASEGLFDLEIKKKIPTLPQRIALITAPSGAAIHDFLNIYNRRSFGGHLLISPALVQGENAPQSIICSLKRIITYSNKYPIDVIVVMRGGGSLEDLWAFNDEKLAREIFNCPIPVVSAVGHQVDFSISDFVSDLRCETPSAAAEILSAKQLEFKENLENSKKNMMGNIEYMLSRYQRKLEEGNPRLNLMHLQNTILTYHKRVASCNIINRLYELTRIHEKHIELDDSLTNMRRVVDNKINSLNVKQDQLIGMLEALNPQKVLGRGYSYLRTRERKVINSLGSFDQLSKDEQFDIHFYDGVGVGKKL